MMAVVEKEMLLLVIITTEHDMLKTVCMVVIIRGCGEGHEMIPVKQNDVRIVVLAMVVMIW